jgi:NAD(P)H dehydrogenase (quinone)
MESTTRRPAFLVCGAAGWTGRRATRLLLDRGHAVRALVRRDDERARHLADAGAEVVVGDMFRLDDVGRALDGVRSAYFVYPIHPGLLEAVAVFAQAATETGVQAVVSMSQITARREAGSNAAQQHWTGERLLDRSPFGVTHLRPTFFAENFLYFSKAVVEENVLRFPFGDGRHAPVAADDQAHVIAAVMEDPAPHAGQTYPLYGPVEMDHYEIAASFSTVLGRTITYEPVEFDDFAPSLVEQGSSDHLIQHLRNVSIDYQNGVFSGTNDVVTRVGRTTPTTIEDFVRTHRSAFVS